MYWKFPTNLFRTVAFQLTLFYFVIFSLVLIGGILLIYFSVKQHLFREIDTRLNLIQDKMAHYLELDSRETLQDEFKREGEARGIDRFFIRLLSADGEVIVSSDLSNWPAIPLPNAIKTGQRNVTVLETVMMKPNSISARIKTQSVLGNRIFQIGVALSEQNHFLIALYQGAALMILLVMPIAAALGYGAARYAMKGVEAVSQTAEKIAQGEFGRRVDDRWYGDEITRLAHTFNNMADRIQNVMSEMREVNDLIAHDLRSPLTRIRMSAESLISASHNQADTIEAAGSIIESSDSLLRLINTMLEISETNAGIRTFSLSSVDLSLLLEKALELFTPLADEKQVSLSLSISDSNPIQGDESKLQRALANLLDNAIKFSSPHKRIKIALTSEPDRVRIDFKDEGIGIPLEEQSKIFERFFRSDRSRHYPGNGLGLCFTQAVIEAHGGRIAVESAPDRGSCFTVFLPCAQQPR